MLIIGVGLPVERLLGELLRAVIGQQAVNKASKMLSVVHFKYEFLLENFLNPEFNSWNPHQTVSMPLVPGKGSFLGSA